MFAFDPFGGYFPGPIYDEALRPPLSLVLFRIASTVWAATGDPAGAGGGRARLGPAALASGGRPPAALPLLVARRSSLYALGGRLGFHITHDDLARELSQTETTSHFVVHTMPGTKSRTERALQIEDLEFRYQQLRQTFGDEPKLPITVWDFPNGAVKKALVGAGETLYAKPWTREMFVQEHFPSSRLRHEMAHVFAGSFGDPFFGVALAWRWGPLPHPALAMGLVEGVAEAATVSDPDGDATIHQEAAAMIAAGLAPPLADVVGAGFSTLAGARAYTLAGSFSAFLLATRGADKLRALYHSAGNFTDVYRVPLRRSRARVAPVPHQAAAQHARSARTPPRSFAARPSSAGSARASWPRASPRRAGSWASIRRARSTFCERPATTIPTSRSTACRWRAPSWRPAPRGRRGRSWGTWRSTER